MAEVAEDLYERMRRRAEKMSIDDAREAMKRAGIIDGEGNLASRYRPPEDEAAATAASVD